MSRRFYWRPVASPPPRQAFPADLLEILATRFPGFEDLARDSRSPTRIDEDALEFLRGVRAAWARSKSPGSADVAHLDALLDHLGIVGAVEVYFSE